MKARYVKTGLLILTEKTDQVTTKLIRHKLSPHFEMWNSARKLESPKIHLFIHPFHKRTMGSEFAE